MNLDPLFERIPPPRAEWVTWVIDRWYDLLCRCKSHALDEPAAVRCKLKPGHPMPHEHHSRDGRTSWSPSERVHNVSGLLHE